MNGTGNNQDNRAETVPDRHPWDVHAKREQLLALWKRYREADDYNRPAVKLLLRNVIDGFDGDRGGAA